jgi:hypothetical protein
VNSEPPKLSNGSATPATPGAALGEQLPPVAVSPPPEPGSTLAAPASGIVPMVSEGAAAASSAKPSLLKFGGRQLRAELVACLDRAADLGEQPSPAACQSPRRAVHHAERPSSVAAADVLPRGADA